MICVILIVCCRRVLLRPVVDMEVLEGRYAAVGWGVNPANLDTLSQLQSCLKHITNVQVSGSASCPRAGVRVPSSHFLTPTAFLSVYQQHLSLSHLIA